VDEALEHYYTNVMVRFFEDRENGVWHTEASKMWFTRASLNAAEILEAKGDWRGVVRVLERVVEAGVPAAEETRARIAAIKAEHWWLY